LGLAVTNMTVFYLDCLDSIPLPVAAREDHILALDLLGMVMSSWEAHLSKVFLVEGSLRCLMAGIFVIGRFHGWIFGQL
jgi:hypothetical protein